METPEKKEFMIKVVRIIATNSYLAEHMQGEMPEEMKKLLEKNQIRCDQIDLRETGLQP